MPSFYLKFYKLYLLKGTDLRYFLSEIVNTIDLK